MMETEWRHAMRYLLCAALAVVALFISGCVNVDLGQASKDWSEVGKSFADTYKQGQTPPAGGQAPQEAPSGR